MANAPCIPLTYKHTASFPMVFTWAKSCCRSLIHSGSSQNHLLGLTRCRDIFSKRTQPRRQNYWTSLAIVVHAPFWSLARDQSRTFPYDLRVLRWCLLSTYSAGRSSPQYRIVIYSHDQVSHHMFFPPPLFVSCRTGAGHKTKKGFFRNYNHLRTTRRIALAMSCSPLL